MNANYRIAINDHTKNDQRCILEFRNISDAKLNIIVGHLVKSGRATQKDFKDGVAKVDKF